MTENIETVLRKFIHHVINLQNEEDPAGTGFTREFRTLREKQVEDKINERFAMTEGKKDENIKKNRYKDIVPRDDRRVKLKLIPGEAGSDYINASLIDDVDGHPGYIAAQGPMPHTVNDFWRMLWQYKAEIVFMACRLKEDSKAKCEKYWADKGESVMFGNIKVYTESEDEIQDHFIKRQLRVEKKGAVHRLTHFQYVGWPDHNVPSSPDALRTMIEAVRNHRRHFNVPMVVHCSAGCGRTGTICAIDFAWTLLDKGMVTEDFSMFEVIKSLREQRISMVQTPDQYEYSHMVMKSLCDEWLVSFAKNDYENVVLVNAGAGDEQPEESYYNLNYPQEQSSTQDSATSNKRTSKESSNSAISTPSTAKPANVKNPTTAAVKPQQKPDILRPKPEIFQKPQYFPPNTNPTIAIYENPPVGSSSDVGSKHGGASRQTPPGFSDQRPPLQEKTRSRQTDHQRNLFAQDNSASAAAPKIRKSGTTGRSALRQKTRPHMGGLQREEGGGGGSGGGDLGAGVYEMVDKSRKNKVTANAPLYENHLLYENHQLTSGSSQLLSDGDYYNEVIVVGGSSQNHQAPALPSRQYKPEEVTHTGSQQQQPGRKSKEMPTDPAPSPLPRHHYDNVTPSFSFNPTPAPASSGAPRPNMHRTHQPIPLTPTTRGGCQTISPRGVRSQGQAVGDSSSSGRDVVGGQSSPFAAVTSSPNLGQPRPGWVDNSSPHQRDLPGVFSGAHVRSPGEAPRCSGEGQKHVVAAPGPGQVIQATVGRKVLVWEARVKRVNGPRPEPASWSTTNKMNQRRF